MSFKQANTIQHIRVDKVGQSYRVNAGDVNFTETSLERAVERLKEAKVFRRPPTSPQSSRKNDPAMLTELHMPLEETAQQREDSGFNGPDANQANEEEGEEKDDQGTQISFIGTMNNKKAEEVLEGHPEGTWMLRYNQRGEVRISIKKMTRVSHLKIYTSTEGYTINPRDDPYPLSDLLNYLRDELKLKTQIASPPPTHNH